jgi:hypothetical protein
MSMPPRPGPLGTPGAAPRRVDPLGAPWPGLIPLRPLSVTDIFGAATRMVGARAGVLVPIALVGSLLSAGATLGALSLFQDQSAYFSDRWMTDALSGRGGIPAVVALPLLAGSAISLLTMFLLSGIAAALVAADSIAPGRPASEALSRLRGRWAAIAAVSVVVAVAVIAGMGLFIAPGLFALAAFAFAAPAVGVERASVGRALRRSIELSRGMRWRVLGITAFSLFIAGMVGGLFTALVPPGDTISSSVLASVVAALVGAVTTPWSAAVIALLFVDARMRRENLAAALVRAAFPL